MANAIKIREVLDYITDHPEEWNQRFYAYQTRCRTAYCAAGHAIILNGHTIKWFTDGPYRRSDAAIRKGSANPNNLMSIETLAAEELELTWQEAHTFFSEGNNLDDLWKLANTFTRGAVGQRTP